jgi:hypothetical protein
VEEDTGTRPKDNLQSERSCVQTTYSQIGAEYRYIRMLMALPFLPSADIGRLFHCLKERVTSPEMKSWWGIWRTHGMAFKE